MNESTTLWIIAFGAFIVITFLIVFSRVYDKGEQRTKNYDASPLIILFQCNCGSEVRTMWDNKAHRKGAYYNNWCPCGKLWRIELVDNDFYKNLKEE